MGMYDTVLVPCPTCGERADFQSKSGRCMLETYLLEDAPDAVLADVNRHAPLSCWKCSTRFGVEVRSRSLKQATPPTIDQVREHAWWWTYPSVGAPHVLRLDVADNLIVIDDVCEPVFRPEDWQGAWAPCIPPTDPPRSVIWEDK